MKKTLTLLTVTAIATVMACGNAQQQTTKTIKQSQLPIKLP